MTRSLAALMAAALLFALGCNPITRSPTPSATSVTGPGGDVSWYFAIEEVGLGPDGYVTLINYTDQPADLDKVYLCQADGCVDLPAAVVAPGDVVRVAVGDGAGLENVVMNGAKLDLPPADGEVAVYGAPTPRDAKAMRSYIQWGKTPHDLTQLADDVGLWRISGWAPSGPNATRLWKTTDGLWVWDPGIG